MRNKLEIRLKHKLQDHLASDDSVSTKNVFTSTKNLFTCTKETGHFMIYFSLLHYTGLVMIVCFFTKEQI